MPKPDQYPIADTPFNSDDLLLLWQNDTMKQVTKDVLLANAFDTYDNSVSGLTATTVQGAIDEIVAEENENIDDRVAALIQDTTTIQWTYDDAAGTLDGEVDTSLFLTVTNNLSDLNNAATARTNLGLEIGADVQAHSAILDATTASYTTAEETKLSNIEANADVTDTANVTAALDGASLTSVTVESTDKVVVQDTSDSDNIKTVTAQSIADLSGDANDIVYSNSSSGLTAVDVQAAIDELDTYNDTHGDVVIYNTGKAQGEVPLNSDLILQDSDVSPSSGTTTLNMNTHEYRKVTASGNFTLDVTPVSGKPRVYVLELVNGGDHTITWTGVDQWPGGTAPTLTSGGTDILVFVADDDGTVRGLLSGEDFS